MVQVLVIAGIEKVNFRKRRGHHSENLTPSNLQASPWIKTQTNKNVSTRYKQFYKLKCAKRPLRRIE